MGNRLPVGLGLALFPTLAFGAETDVSFVVNNLWLLIAAAMVFVMHLGFATLEAGSVRSKNVTTILFKNTAIIAIGLLTYAAVGFSTMYPGAEFAGGFFGFSGPGISPGADGLTSAYNPAYTYYTDFIFQAMFAATAATIVSGAVAERIKLIPFLIFTTIFLSVCYPIVGMWKWGGGFLNTLSVPFYDFAGSTIVHSVGGWAALAGAMILGPRLHRFTAKRQPTEFLPGNNPLVCIGMFLLWFGWYGFNGGSVLSADPAALSLVFVTTSLGAAAGIFGGMVVGKLVNGYEDLSCILNGALGGLVAITAGADVFGPLDAALVGLLGGALVVVGMKLIEKVKIDDPVGAIAVHLVGGIWGTLAVGLFGSKASLLQLGSQLIGVVAVGVFTLTFSIALFLGLKKMMGLRVSEDIEESGIDAFEHMPQVIPLHKPTGKSNFGIDALESVRT